MALVEFRPITGRTHQIRVHAAEAGWPIAGDTIYASGEARLAAPRLMLHAASLELPGAEGGSIVIEAPWPDDFTTYKKVLGPAIGEA